MGLPPRSPIFAAGWKRPQRTVPFKLEACRIATRLTERAEAAQAVNTLACWKRHYSGGQYRRCGVGTGHLRQPANFRLHGQTGIADWSGRSGARSNLPLLEHEPRMLVIANRSRKERTNCSNGFPATEISSPSIIPIFEASSSILSSTPPPPASMANCLRFPPVFLPGKRWRMT